MFKAIHRRFFKAAVVTEFHRLYGVNLRGIGDMIGPGNLDDILNVQYVDYSGNAERAARAIHEVIETSYGINIAALKLRAELDADRG